MKDREVRDLVLNALYEIRHTNPHAAIPADVPDLLGIEPNVLLGIVRQLRDKGLIEFTGLSGGENMLGRGKITAYGIDAVEENAARAENWKTPKASRMTLQDLILELEHRAGELTLMVLRSQSDHSNWQEPYRRMVYELTDLFDDHTRNNDYAKTLRTEFSSMLRPDTYKLQNLSALIKSAATRLERKPELFKENDQDSGDTFFTPTVTTHPPLKSFSTLHDAGDIQHDLTRRITIIEAMLAQRRERHRGIGDNNPPQDFPTADSDIDEIEKLITLLKEQSPKSGVLPAVTSTQTSRVSELSDKFFDKLTEQAGSELGKKLPDIGFWYGLYTAVRDLVRTVWSLF